jgi:hypothetical protein
LTPINADQQEIAGIGQNLVIAKIEEPAFQITQLPNASDPRSSALIRGKGFGFACAIC